MSGDATITVPLAVAALGLGPLLALASARRPSLVAGLDGFVIATVGGLCLLHLLPHAVGSLSIYALPVAVAGFFLPYLAERALHRHTERESSPLLLLALGGLLLHSAIDGAALAGVGHDHGPGEAAHAAEEASLALPLAVIVHRLPVGLLIWLRVGPALGRRVALGLLGLLGAGTVAGAAASGPLLAQVGASAVVGVLEALLAGGLLHVILDHGPQAPRRPAASALGAILGIGLFVLLPLEETPRFDAAMVATRELFLESSPALLIGFVGAGLLSLVPTETLSRLMRGRTIVGSALRGVVFGLPLPVCSCGVVPIYRGLVRKGVPAAAAIAFLVATPELGVDAIVISIPLLGIPLTVTRLIAAFALALIAGMIAGLLSRGDEPAPAGAASDAALPGQEGATGSPVRRALRYGLVESVDDLGPWILAGLVVAGLMGPLLDPAWIARIPAGLDVPLFAGIAAPIYVCASAATPVAAVFLLKGASAGAVIAFLLTGPATNVTTYGALAGVHGRRVTLLLIAGILIACLAIGTAVNAFAPVTAASVPPISGHAHGPVHVVSAVLFAGLLLASLLRQGVRGFLAQLGLIHGEHEHEHEHHDHDHQHGHGEPAGASDAAGGDACCGPRPACASAPAAPSDVTAAGS